MNATQWEQDELVVCTQWQGDVFEVLSYPQGLVWPENQCTFLLVLQPEVFAASECIDTPDSSSLGGDEEKNETVQHRQFSLVLDRQQSICAVPDPIGSCHQTAGEECRPDGKQADHDQYAANELDWAGDVDDEGGDFTRYCAWKAEQFLGTMPEKKKTGNDPH